MYTIIQAVRSVQYHLKEPSLDASIYLLVLYYMNSGSLGQIIFHWSNAPTLLHYTLWLGMSIVVIYKPSPAFRRLYFEAYNMHMYIPAV